MLKSPRSSLSPQPVGTPPTKSLFSEFVWPRSAELTADSAKRTCKGLRKGGRERWLWSALIADWAEMREENLTKQQPCKVEEEGNGI